MQKPNTRTEFKRHWSNIATSREFTIKYTHTKKDGVN